MGIRFLCPNGHKLNVKADLAGKRASCPECGAKLVVPGATPGPAKAPAAAVVRSASPVTAVWYMQTPDGQQFGPATDEQFSEWISAGRLGADSHVWRDGWPEWKVARHATDLLPKPLAAAPVASPQVAPPPAAAVPPAAPAVHSPARQAEPVAAPNPAPEPEPAAVVAEPVVEENALPTAAVYALRKQRRQKTQVTLAVMMLLAVIVLAGVLVWVIASNSSAGPPVSQASVPARESENT